MVMLEAVGFVALGAVAVVHGTRQAAVLKKPQGAVNGGEANARVLLAHLLVQFLGGEVPLGGEKHFQNVVAGSGMFEVLAAEIVFENLEFIRHEGTFLAG